MPVGTTLSGGCGNGGMFSLLTYQSLFKPCIIVSFVERAIVKLSGDAAIK